MTELRISSEGLSCGRSVRLGGAGCAGLALLLSRAVVPAALWPAAGGSLPTPHVSTQKALFGSLVYKFSLSLSIFFGHVLKDKNLSAPRRQTMTVTEPTGYSER